MESEVNKPVYVFGQDIRKVVCFRDTFLYGISSGVAMGLGTFLFTSKPRFSCHVGFASYVIVGMGYWFQCRIRYVNSMFNSAQIQEVMDKNIALQGTQEINEEYIRKNLKNA